MKIGKYDISWNEEAIREISDVILTIVITIFLIVLFGATGFAISTIISGFKEGYWFAIMILSIDGLIIVGLLILSIFIVDKQEEVSD